MKKRSTEQSIDFKRNELRKSYSPSFAPELIAIAKRINMTLVDAARALLLQANVPKYL